jgi:hypothetical protein
MATALVRLTAYRNRILSAEGWRIQRPCPSQGQAAERAGARATTAPVPRLAANESGGMIADMKRVV